MIVDRDICVGLVHVSIYARDWLFDLLMINLILIGCPALSVGRARHFVE